VCACVRIADQALVPLYCFFGRATVPSCRLAGSGACAVVLLRFHREMAVDYLCTIKKRVI